MLKPLNPREVATPGNDYSAQSIGDHGNDNFRSRHKEWNFSADCCAIKQVCEYNPQVKECLAIGDHFQPGEASRDICLETGSGSSP
jgi:hypothetical protein